MKEGGERKEFGYVSGRTAANFIQSSKLYGLEEVVLRSVPLGKSFDYYVEGKNPVLWNELIALIEAVYEKVGTFDEMEKIGAYSFEVMKTEPSYLWVTKILTLRTVLRFGFSYRYNFLDLNISSRLEGDEATITYELECEGDRFSEPFFHVLKGYLMSSMEMWGYVALTDINLLKDPTRRRVHYRCQLPKRRGVWHGVQELLKGFFVRKEMLNLMGAHSAELAEVQRKKTEELESLYGLIGGIRDAVLIICGERVLMQNAAFTDLVAHEAKGSWEECFEAPEEVRQFVCDFAEERQLGDLGTVLRREGLPSIKVSVNVVSVQNRSGEYEAILKIYDLSVPPDPREIVATVKEQERKSLARDMHDSLGQLLTASSFQMAALEQTEKDQKRGEKLAQISQMLREIALYSRSFTRQLDLLVDECDSMHEAVELVGNEFSIISGVEVRNDVSHEFTLEHPEAIRHLSCVVQEALNNAYRHGHATCVVVASKKDETGVEEWLMEDNGRGMSLGGSEKGLGLRSMEYRVSTLGGRMTLSKSQLGGVRISCKFNGNQ